MKYFPSLIFSLLLITVWSCSDMGEPYIEDCMDETACNFNPDANIENYDLCSYEFDACGICGGTVENLDDCCDEGEEPDCLGECEGTAEIDKCGECEGDGLSCINYDLEIQSIFTGNCSCHISGNQNNLILTTYENTMAGDSDTGPVIIPFDHAGSRLWEYIESGYMPFGGTPLIQSQIDLIASWIDGGALDTVWTDTGD